MTGSVVSVASPPSDISSDMSSLQLASDISSSVPGSSVTQGAAGDSIDWGATRGRRDQAPNFLVRTKITKPNWRLLQYHVDMKPDIDMTKVGVSQCDVIPLFLQYIILIYVIGPATTEPSSSSLAWSCWSRYSARSVPLWPRRSACMFPSR